MIAVDAVLFDLDGTLVDTAPEFIIALGRLREELGMPPVPADRIRPVVSKGGAAMVQAAFADWPAGDRAALLERFLALYREQLGSATDFFPGIVEVLERLDRRGTPWGIVTNKPGWLTEPLLAALRLNGRPRCVISGDSLPVRKPDPAPVRVACSLLHAVPARTAMVGDDERDVAAALAAGAIAVLADWGYSEDAGADGWGAQHRAASPLVLAELLGLPPWIHGGPR